MRISESPQATRAGHNAGTTLMIRPAVPRHPLVTSPGEGLGEERAFASGFPTSRVVIQVLSM